MDWSQIYWIKRHLCANYSGFNLHQAQQMSFSINVSYSKYFSLKYSNFLSGLFFYRYSKILFNLVSNELALCSFNRCLGCAVNHSEIILCHIFLCWQANMVSSAFKAHFQRRKIIHVSVVHWLRLHCMTTLLIVGHLLAGHNCARTRCNV